MSCSGWGNFTSSSVLLHIVRPGTAQQIWVSRAVQTSSAAGQETTTGKVVERRQGQFVKLRIYPYVYVFRSKSMCFFRGSYHNVLFHSMTLSRCMDLYILAGVQWGAWRSCEGCWSDSSTFCVSPSQCTKQGNPVLRWDWPVPEDRPLCQESRSYSRLHFPAA